MRQHSSRQVTADRFEDVIGHTHLGKLGRVTGPPRLPKAAVPEVAAVSPVVRSRIICPT